MGGWGGGREREGCIEWGLARCGLCSVAQGAQTTNALTETVGQHGPLHPVLCTAHTFGGTLPDPVLSIISESRSMARLRIHRDRSNTMPSVTGICRTHTHAHDVTGATAINQSITCDTDDANGPRAPATRHTSPAYPTPAASQHTAHRRRGQQQHTTEPVRGTTMHHTANTCYSNAPHSRRGPQVPRGQWQCCGS